MNVVKYIGDWQVNHIAFTLSHNTQIIRLEKKQYDLLMLFIKHAEQGLSKQTILDEIWAGKVVTEDTIYVAINSLRKSLQDDAKIPRYIKTLPGYGYQLIAPIKYKRKISKQLKLSAFMCLFFCIIWIGIAQFRVNQGNDNIIPILSVQDKESFVRAQFLNSLASPQIQEAISLLTKLKGSYPNYQPILTQLALSHFKLLNKGKYDIEKVRLILTLLEQALQRNKDDKLAHLIKARELFLYKQEMREAEKHFIQALPLPETYHHYSQFLLALGKFESALKYIDIYRDLHPQSYSSLSVAWVYTMSRQFAKAHVELNKIKPFKSDDLYFHVSLQSLYEQTNKELDAFEELKQIMMIAGYSAKDLADITREFKTEKLRGAYNWLLSKDTKKLNIGQYSPPLSLARYAVGAEQYDVAISLIEQAISEKQYEVLWVAIDPKYTPLFSEHRFQMLLKKINLTN